MSRRVYISEYFVGLLASTFPTAWLVEDKVDCYSLGAVSAFAQSNCEAPWKTSVSIVTSWTSNCLPLPVQRWNGSPGHSGKILDKVTESMLLTQWPEDNADIQLFPYYTCNTLITFEQCFFRGNGHFKHEKYAAENFLKVVITHGNTLMFSEKTKIALEVCK